MIRDSKIIEIFCLLDDFSKEHNTLITQNSLPGPSVRKDATESVECLMEK